MIYSIANDTLNGTVSESDLEREVSNSSVTIAIDNISSTGDVLTITFKAALSTQEETDLNAIVAAHDGVITQEAETVNLSNKSSIQSAISVINHKPEENSFARATHDFCNKTTWYTNSVRVEVEILLNPVNLVYTCANTHLIDVINGNINRQDLLQEYKINVYDAGVLITDYTVNHASGEITLGSAVSGEVTVDYSYATNSEWKLVPDAGKTLIMDHSEVQFSVDVVMNTPLRFEIWVYNPGHLIPGHPYEFYGLKIPYQTVQYNSIKDLVNEANLGTGTIPAIGNLPECVVFPFNYASIKPLASSQGVELRIRANNDVELTGSFGTATFYLIERSET